MLLALLAGGADPNASGAHDIALHRAATVGSISAVEALLAAGADANATSPMDGKAALHIVAGTDDTSIMDALFRRGAAVDIHDDFSFTPLHFAAGRGCLAAAKMLLRRGADVAATDTNSFTPLHLAAGKEQQTSPPRLHLNPPPPPYPTLPPPPLSFPKPSTLQSNPTRLSNMLPCPAESYHNRDHLATFMLASRRPCTSACSHTSSVPGIVG